MNGPGAQELAQAVEAFSRGELDSARSIAEREVAARPSPQWHHLLGLIHCRLGDPERGVGHLRAAAEAESGNMAFQLMLARALIDSGRAAEVVAMPPPPPPTSPATLALWQARAESAAIAGRPEIGTEAWAKISATQPRDWLSLAGFGNALAAQGRWPEAADALVEAANLNPAEAAVGADAVTALLESARHHEVMLDFEASEAALRRAYSLAPSNPSVVHRLGVALERTNRLEDLSRLVDEALVSGFGEDRLAYLRAILARRGGRLEEARDLLVRAGPDDDPVAWNALKAKIADALGDTREAFEAAVAMNRSAKQADAQSIGIDEWDRKAADYRSEQHELARTITPEWAARIPVLDELLLKRVAFLLGFPRSGTTLLDTFLLGHPEIAVIEEKQLVGAAAAVTGPIESLPDISRARLKRGRATYFERLSENVRRGFRGLAIDKFPLDMASAPLIHAMFPQAPIIFAQRHPCDVVLSGFMQPFGTVNFSSIADASDYYHAMMSIWTASLEALPLNVHTVVYEELVSDPEPVLKPLVAFLGLDWDERILDHQRSARERGTIVTPSYDQVTEPVTTRASGRWRRYREQLEPVLPVLLPWAERLGYRD
ncbi:tetratricopeptide repeat-containing sulfotransferase family protein [soil metagenome]